MRITNNANLPTPVIRAVNNDSYDRGACDFTATELLLPARARVLAAQHANEITEDVSDLLWRLLGQIGHAVLERAGDPDYVERRFYGKVAGKMISGRADLHFDGGFYHIWDYKFTSVYTVKNGMKPEWEQQVNMLRWLVIHDMRRDGLDVHVDKGSICAIYRDWSKPKAARDRNYPQMGVQVLPVKMWPLATTLKFMEGRVRAHLDAQDVLPLCTDEERWATNEQWAVKKKGAKRAERLFDNEKIANLAAHQWGMQVEHRPKEYKRCAIYCRAFPFCKQANPNLMQEDL
jgi:hypothetical protein